jgi:hypothetical protein
MLELKSKQSESVMKINQKSTKKSLKFFIALGLITACLLAVGVFLIIKSHAPTPKPAKTSQTTLQHSNPAITDPATQDQIDAGNKAKTNSADNSNPTPNPGTSLVLTVNQFLKAPSVTHVEVNINGVFSSGTCTLTLTQGSTVNTLPQVGIQALSNYSVCKGFDIDTSGYAHGDWIMNITVTADSHSGSTKGKISV